MAEWSDDELRRAAAGARDKQFASFLAFAFCLACEEYPDQMAAALGGLPGFDFAAVTAEAGRIVGLLHAVADQAQEAKYLNESVGKDLDRTADRIGELESRVEKAARAMGRLAEQFRSLVRLAQECKR